MRGIRCVLMWAAMAGCVAAMTLAQETTRSPEVARLGDYVGHWSSTGQMRDDPAKPFTAITGGETCSWAAGGVAVLCQEKAGGESGGWEGVYILSYDAASGQYHVYGTETPGLNMHAVGRVEGERWTWHTDPAPDGSRLRYSFTPAGEGGRTMTVEAGAGDDWTPVVKITYTLEN